MVSPSNPTNGQSTHRPRPQDIIDAEFLEDVSPNEAPSVPLHDISSPGITQPVQPFQQFEQRLGHQLQTWQNQQIHGQQRDRAQRQQQFQTLAEQTQVEFHRLHNHLAHLERKLDYNLRERQLESKRRSIFLLLAVFVIAIVYITVVYPLIQRPKVRVSPPIPQTAPQAAT